MVCLASISAALGDFSAFTLETFSLTRSPGFLCRYKRLWRMNFEIISLTDRVPMVCLASMNAALGDFSAFTVDTFGLISCPCFKCRWKRFWRTKFQKISFSALILEEEAITVRHCFFNLYIFITSFLFLDFPLRGLRNRCIFPFRDLLVTL